MKKFYFIFITALFLSGCTASLSTQGWNSFNRGATYVAEQQWIKGAERGELDSIFGLGVLADPSIERVGAKNKDKYEAGQHYYRAANQGHLLSMNNLGLLLITHGENDEDLNVGIQYLTLAARNGQKDAIDNLTYFNLPVPEPDLARDREIKEAMTLALIALSSYQAGMSSPTSTSYDSLMSDTPITSTSSGCITDLSCGHGQRCQKAMNAPRGICMTEVDKQGLKTNRLPSPTLEMRAFGTEKCRFNTECPTGFRCDQKLYVCVK